MNKKKMLALGSFFLIAIIFTSGIFINSLKDKSKDEIKEMEAMIISNYGTKLTVQDKNNVIYTFDVRNEDFSSGTNILLKYTGLLNNDKTVQDVSVVDLEVNPVSNDDGLIPTTWDDNGIFSNFYKLAKAKLDTMTLEEKIGQLFLVRYPENNALEHLKKYKFAGYIFFEKDFKNKDENEVKSMLNILQDNTNIPILTAVDEEGGSVVRVSSNEKLASEKFLSPRDLYLRGGFPLIKDDTITKSKLLKNLGLNLNLAPVVDVSTNPDDYMYDRTIGEDTEITSKYAKTVVEASKDTGVSYTLKHFPGYGDNDDTHNGVVTDNRSKESILQNDIPPFQTGIDAGAEAILVNHNIVNSIDKNNPASLSTASHNLLRNDLGFTGVIMTDDLDMGATSSIDNKYIKAIAAGNDLLLTTNYEEAISEVKEALEDGTLTEDAINRNAFRVLSWKYYKGIMFENHK